MEICCWLFTQKHISIWGLLLLAVLAVHAARVRRFPAAIDEPEMPMQADTFVGWVGGIARPECRLDMLL